MCKKNNSKNRRGIAMMLVIAALSMLVLIAIPFATSMRVEKRASGSSLAKTRAKLAAQGSFHYAVGKLTQTHDFMERSQAQKAPYNTPHYDSPEEYKVDVKLKEYKTKDSKGSIWSVSVEDEQGKVNINSATPWLLGNIIASAIATDETVTSSGVIQVDSTSNFPQENGILWINKGNHSDFVRYARKKNNVFVGCQREVLMFGDIYSEPINIKPGDMICDARAYAICYYRSVIRPFRTLEEIKNIADIGKGEISATLFERITPFLTVHSKRSSNHGRINEQPILNDLPNDDPKLPDTVVVSNRVLYGRGLMVRLAQGNIYEHAFINKVDQAIRLDRRLKKRFVKGKAKIAVLQPHPININSASPKVLFSLFKGIRAGSNWIDSKEAVLIVEAILELRSKGDCIHSLEHFRDFLENLRKKLATGQVLDGQNRLALNRKEVRQILSTAYSINGHRHRFIGVAMNPLASQYKLPFPVFAPICYSNSNSYTITASGVVNSSNGVPLTEYSIKRVVDIAPAKTLTWNINTQRDFREQLHNLPSLRVISYPNLVNLFSSFAKRSPGKKTGLAVDSVPLAPKPQGTIQQYFPFNETYDGIQTENGGPTLTCRLRQKEVIPGAVAFWFKPQRIAGKLVFFDSNPGKFSDRITCFYQGGKLFLQIYDATLDKSQAEVVAPLALQNQWIHIMAAWYSTRPGEMSLWIDGQAVGLFRYRRDPATLNTTLKKSLTEKTEIIQLDNAGGFLNRGVIKIGDEVIEYEKRSGNRLAVRKSYQGFEINVPVARGARGSQAKKHPAGAIVSVFGYSDKLATDVFPATRISSSINEESLFTTLSSDVANNATSLPVKSAKNFPSSGFLLVSDPTTGVTEKIRYASRKNTGFIKCIRAQLSTSAQDFTAGSHVIPLSVLVEDSTLYPDGGFIQVDNEWIEYTAKIDQNILVFSISSQDLSLIGSGKFRPAYRGAKGTVSSSHAGGSLAIPVFQTTLGFPGRFDKITLVDDNDPEQKEQREVNWSINGLVALTEDVSIVYSAGSTSIAKFPTERLPKQATSFQLGATSSFHLDELQFIQKSSRRVYILSQPLAKNSTKILVNRTSGLPIDGGIIKIGDEYISYSGIQGQEFLGVKRGFFTSQKGVYTQGQTLFPIFFIAASSLTKGISGQEASLSLRGALDFPREGYIKCDNEIIGYTRNDQGTLSMPVIKGTAGLRGAFGSQIQNHSADTVAYFFPVRYWDRFLDGYSGIESSYFEAAKTAPGAYWEKIEWQEHNVSDKFLQTKILVRIDGRPSWDKAPQNREGEIFAFTSPNAKNFIGVRGDTLEFRVFFLYKKGAFSRGYWKNRILLENIKVRYKQTLMVHQAE